MKFTLTEDIVIEDVPERSIEGLKLFYRGSGHEFVSSLVVQYGTTDGDNLYRLTLRRVKTWERPAAGQERRK